jgi:succinyl-CoA synthetase beta subunit
VVAIKRIGGRRALRRGLPIGMHAIAAARIRDGALTPTDAPTRSRGRARARNRGTRARARGRLPRLPAVPARARAGQMLITHQQVARPMKLYEYQGRELLVRYGVPSPSGVVVGRPEELEAARAQLQFPVVVKAQVLVGGRGKAGGIQFANDFAEAKAQAQRILAMRIKDLAVRKVLLVQKFDFVQELYVSLVLDRSSRHTLLMASARGGVDIESVADAEIHKVLINPLSGYQPYHGRELLGPMKLKPEVRKQFEALLPKLYKAYREMDCELLEVNPLAVTSAGQLIAADAKVILNDGALFRHKEYQQPDEELTPLEQEAKAQNIAFIQLPGNIGVIANGAGLTMATLDALNEYGGQAGVFLDLGGTDDPEQVTRAFRLMKKAKPRVCLVNLFGGITKTDTVAAGLKWVLDSEGVDFPIVARIKGTNEARAKEILKDAGLLTANTLQEAAKLASETAVKGVR